MPARSIVPLHQQFSAVLSLCTAVGESSCWTRECALQGKACREAANDVVRKVTELMTKKRGQLTDDTSCMVIDCKPHAVATFKGYTPNQSLGRSSTSTSHLGSFDHSMHMHTHTNSNIPGASVHGAYRIPGGVWAQDMYMGANNGRVGSGRNSAASCSSGKQHKSKARRVGLLSCCFPSSKGKDGHASTGELEAAFGSVHSMDGAHHA